MTRTFGENFWRRSHQWARRMGQAILLVRHQKFSPNLHKWACLQAKTCSALKHWDGSFTLSLFFARKSPGSRSPCNQFAALWQKRCAVKSQRKTIGIKWPSPDLYRDKIVSKDISRDSIASRSTQSLLSRPSSRKKDPSYLLKNQNSVGRGCRHHLALVSGITGREETRDKG